MEGLPEPLIEEENCQSCAVLETFGPVQQVPDFEIARYLAGEHGYPAQPARGLCGEYENCFLVGMANITSTQFAEGFFDNAFVQCSKNVALVYATHGLLRVHGLVQRCREHPAAFSTVVE